jgi:hypothetical protein
MQAYSLPVTLSGSNMPVMQRSTSDCQVERPLAKLPKTSTLKCPRPSGKALLALRRILQVAWKKKIWNFTTISQAAFRVSWHESQNVRKILDILHYVEWVICCDTYISITCCLACVSSSVGTIRLQNSSMFICNGEY